ncbi:unnamed protein product, partial [Rotaria sp. Silwood2]
YNKVLYPYKNKDLTARTHNSYVKAVREAIRKSNGGTTTTSISYTDPKAMSLFLSTTDSDLILA